MTDDRSEPTFQRHIARYLEKQQDYTVLEAEDISDKDFYLVESVLLGFIKATQPDTLKALESVYGAGAFTEIISVLKSTLEHKTLWLIMRTGLSVDNHRFQLFYPMPRSSNSISHQHWQENRFQLKTELIIKDNKHPDIVLFLNGLPIVVIELKHEKSGQTVHDAVKQFNSRNHDDKIFQLPFLYVAMVVTSSRIAGLLYFKILKLKSLKNIRLNLINIIIKSCMPFLILPIEILMRKLRKKSLMV